MIRNTNLKSIFVKTESIFSGLGAVTASSCLNLDVVWSSETTATARV